MRYQTMTNPDLDLRLLQNRVFLDLSLNELRIILSSLRALKHRMELDNEPYLDPDGIALVSRLEHTYTECLNPRCRSE